MTFSNLYLKEIEQKLPDFYEIYSNYDYSNFLENLEKGEKLGSTFQSYLVRQELVNKYSWAIPNEEAIQTLVDYSPIIEVGAGTGYWASLISQERGDILAFDNSISSFNSISPSLSNSIFISPSFSPYENCQAGNKYYLVEKGNENIVRDYSNRTLFLCWPPYKEKMAFNCLNNYKGNTLIYIGEERGGCTADEAFFNLLDKDWKLIKEISIPQWPYIHDYLFIYKRKLNVNL
jgi:hypothetical protein